MILLVDNYDSFSYNLYQLAGSINPDMKVIRNDEMTIDEICALAPASIILSPGPGRPEQAGRCMEIVKKLGGEIPILGVCRGHQAICAAYGATVTYAKQLMTVNSPRQRWILPRNYSRGCRKPFRLQDTIPSQLMKRHCRKP